MAVLTGQRYSTTQSESSFIDNSFYRGPTAVLVSLHVLQIGACKQPMATPLAHFYLHYVLDAAGRSSCVDRRVALDEILSRSLRQC